MDNPDADDQGQGLVATRAIMGEARKLAQSVQDPRVRAVIVDKAAECEKLCNELDEMMRNGMAGTPQVSFC